ncbi:MAG: hypothetical protein IKJ98_08750 [Bacteroidales bacterium]|nr:hypothetical protein [Bacteroidales bacterium]
MHNSQCIMHNGGVSWWLSLSKPQTFDVRFDRLNDRRHSDRREESVYKTK